MKDAAKDAAEDVAGDVLGAAEDGSVEVLMSIAIFQWWNPRPTHACRPHACP